MPVIALSRGTRVGASRIAEGVAEELDIPCLSREILAEAAADFGVSEKLLSGALERPPSFFDRISLEHDMGVRFVMSALCRRAAEGSFVYHGLVGHLHLGGVPNVLSVRVLAPLPLRVEAVMTSRGWDEKRATAHIEKVDRERGRWTKFLYGVDWQDPALYDLVVNLAHLDVDDGIELICALARLDRFQWTEEKTKAAADTALARQVYSELGREVDTRSAKLEVSADAGMVTICGTALRQQICADAVALAEKVPGVASVRCEMTSPTDLLRK